MFCMSLLYEVCLYSWIIFFTSTTAYLFYFILGNDIIYILTKGRTSTLYVRVKFENHTDYLYQTYGQFFIFDEGNNYVLSLANPGDGNLGKFFRRCII